MKRVILVVVGVASALASTQAISSSNDYLLMNNQVYLSSEKSDLTYSFIWERKL